MNKSYPILLFFFILGLQSLNKTNAQSNSFGFIHVVGGVPTDESTKSKYSSIFGIDAGYGIGYKMSYFIISIGYLPVTGKDSFKTETYVPLKAGIRQYFTDAKTIYAVADIGAGFVSNSLPTKQTLSPSSTCFAFDAGIGLNLKAFEAQINYDVFKEPMPDGYSGFAELKIGWKFDFKK